MTERSAIDLVRDHEELDRLFDALDPKLSGDAAGAALRHLDRIWARLAVHIRAEHLVMFPALRAVPAAGGRPTPGEMEADLARLAEDHDRFMRDLAAAVNRLKACVAAGVESPVPAEVAGEVRGLVGRVRAGLGPHNALEEDRVYRWLDTFLPAGERTAIRDRMRRQLEAMPDRFAGGDGAEPEPLSPP